MTPDEEVDIYFDHEEEIEEFLSHYGVKGMKWGVRRSSKPKSARQERRAEKKAELKRIREKQKSGQRLTMKERQKVQDHDTKVALATTAAVYAAFVGAAYFSSPQFKANYSNMSYKIADKITATKMNRPSRVERQVKEYIRKGPPPSKFTDVSFISKIPKGREIELFRG